MTTQQTTSGYYVKPFEAGDEDGQSHPQGFFGAMFDHYHRCPYDISPYVVTKSGKWIYGDFDKYFLITLSDGARGLGKIWDGDNPGSIIELTGWHKSAQKWTWEEYKEVVKQQGLKIFTKNGSVYPKVGDYIFNLGDDLLVVSGEEVNNSVSETKQVKGE